MHESSFEPRASRGGRIRRAGASALALLALHAACSAPSRTETTFDPSLRPRRVHAFVVPALARTSYHLGRQPNRYERAEDPHPRHTVLVKTRHEARGQRLDVHYGYNGVSDFHVSLLFEEDREHVTATMTWRGDVGGVPPTVWTDVGGVVLVDRWPTDSLTPFRARFLLWGDRDGALDSVSDAVSTEDAPKSDALAPE